MIIDIERLKTDLDYWLSVAPEGATHCGPDPEADFFWYDANNKVAYSGETKMWVTSLSTDDYWASLIPRPSPTWNGEGLPPAGVECEFLWGGVSQGVVEIIQYRGSKAIFWRKEKDHVDSAELPTAAFRPLKTEKERAVEAALIELSLVAGFHDRDREVADALYDAGMLKEPTND